MRSLAVVRSAATIKRRRETDEIAESIGTGLDQVRRLGLGGFAAFGANRAVRFTPDPNTSVNWTEVFGTGRVLILSHDTVSHSLPVDGPVRIFPTSRCYPNDR